MPRKLDFVSARNRRLIDVSVEYPSRREIRSIGLIG